MTGIPKGNGAFPVNPGCRHKPYWQEARAQSGHKTHLLEETCMQREENVWPWHRIRQPGFPNTLLSAVKVQRYSGLHLHPLRMAKSFRLRTGCSLPCSGNGKVSIEANRMAPVSDRGGHDAFKKALMQTFLSAADDPDDMHTKGVRTMRNRTAITSATAARGCLFRSTGGTDDEDA